jgi:P-type Ca2+ transporter type 2C
VVGSGVIGLNDSSGAVVLPLLATQLLWLNLITDTWPALAIGIDPPSDDVMRRAVRPPNERVISPRMWMGMLENGVLVAIVTLLTIDMNLPGGLIEGTQDLSTARTAGLTVLVFAHLFNAFIARSASRSAFFHPFTNLWLWAALALSVVLQVAVVNIGVLNLAFGTTPLTLTQWGMCFAMSSGVLVYSECRKRFMRLG